MLDQPDELGRRAGRNRGGARVHGGDRLWVADRVRAHGPFDRAEPSRRLEPAGKGVAHVNHSFTIAWSSREAADRTGFPGIMATLDKVSLNISVVLGTTSMPVHQVLRLGRGAVIELDAGENDEVRILANDFPVAKGAVVVSGNRIAVEVKRMLPRTPDMR